MVLWCNQVAVGPSPTNDNVVSGPALAPLNDLLGQWWRTGGSIGRPLEV